MRPLRRMGVSKSGSASQFRRNASRTKRPNVTAVSRGGIRL